MARKGEPDAIWNAATAECYPSGVATGMRKEVNGLVRDLKDLEATAAEVHRRAPLYREYCKTHDLMFSLRGLVRRWDQFPKPRKRKTRDDMDAEQRRRESAIFLRREVLAGQILARHTDEECKAAWTKYVESLGSRARFLGKRQWPVPIAERLEPGVLDRMMQDAV